MPVATRVETGVGNRAGLTALSNAEPNSYMLSAMDNPDRIHTFLVDRTPAPVCDDCVANGADVSPRQQINPIARALSLTSDFDRVRGECSICGATKLVTRSLRHA